jgi:hypothetical protein
MWPFETARRLVRFIGDNTRFNYYTAARSIRPETAHELAHACYYKGLHAAAARLYGEALALDPKHASDRHHNPRYSAARSAALAGSGQSKDVPPPNEAARRQLRGQARDWLMAELAERAKVLQSQGPRARPFIAQMLRQWKVCLDLAGIRDRDAPRSSPPTNRRHGRPSGSTSMRS